MDYSGMFASFDGSPVKLLGRSGTVRAGVADSRGHRRPPMRADTPRVHPLGRRVRPVLTGPHREPAPHGEPGRVGRGGLLASNPPISGKTKPPWRRLAPRDERR